MVKKSIYETPESKMLCINTEGVIASSGEEPVYPVDLEAMEIIISDWYNI